MSPIDRRTFLKAAGALGLAGLATPLVPAAAATLRRRNPIQRIIIDLQENRSFDHYYGFASFAGKYGVPSGYSQPDGSGGAGGPAPLPRPPTPAIARNPGATA